MVWDGTLAGDSAIGSTIGSIIGLEGTIVEHSAVGVMPEI